MTTIREAASLIPDRFTPVPSLAWLDQLAVRLVDKIDDSIEVIGVTVFCDGDLPDGIPDRDVLSRLGFEGKPGQTVVLTPNDGPVTIVVGSGGRDTLTTDTLRDVAAAFARACQHASAIALRVTSIEDLSPVTAAQAIVEGALLARYRYGALKAVSRDAALLDFSVSIDRVPAGEAVAAVASARASVRASCVARDLANTPAGHLTATNLADVAVELGERFGFTVDVFDKKALIDLGCGGILGVNAGSSEEPRMIRLSYAGPGTHGTIAMVGKGIMYDSGGISLKPSDPMHLLMKMDMGGAAAVLGTFTALQDVHAETDVTAWLMCTDNMPSGSAYKLGDVLTARGGKTVEVKNTDAEGRLAMMDGLVLAAESDPDAIIDIATLTGAALMALGPLVAALLGNNQSLIDQVISAGTSTNELAWQLPLQHRYRPQLDSQVADIANLGGPFAGAITAALFLNEFVDGKPWAHLDIAGTMNSNTDDSWRSAGATGFGARLLLNLVVNFTAAREPAE